MILATFFSGIAFATFAAAGIFFLKFYRVSRDPFFLYFAAACWLMSLERAVAMAIEEFIKVGSSPPEAGILSYVIRLAGFSLIFVAVLRKNQRNRSDSKSPTK